MTYFPKQRGKKTYRLCKEDLAPRRVSLNPSDFDFTEAIESHTPQMMTDAQFTHIPVYNRKSNRINRYSRAVSQPVKMPIMLEFVEVRSASMNHQSREDKNEFYSQPMNTAAAHTFGYGKIRQQSDLNENLERKNQAEDLRYQTEYLSSKGAARIQAWVDHHSSLSSLAQSLTKLLYGGYGSNRSHGSKDYYQSESSAGSDKFSDSSRSDHLQTPAIHNTSVQGFPRFIPPVKHQNRHSNYYKLSSKLEPSVCSREDKLNWAVVDASSLSQKSTGDSQKSVSTTASPETEMLSLEMCNELDVSSFYEDDESSVVNVRPSVGENAYEGGKNIEAKELPELPKHKGRYTPDSSTTHKKATGSRQVSRLFVPKFEYCLDLGAEYDKSRFMIPQEYQVARSKQKNSRPQVRACV